MQEFGFKIFFIGPNKCGTQSLSRWLRDTGKNPFHGGEEKANYHRGILINVAQDKPPLDGGLDGYDAYLDVGAVQTQFRAIDHHYPGSKFVLNTRNIDRWILSRLNHIAGRYVTYMNLYYGIDLSWSEWADRWRREFAEQERTVLAHFHGRSDFLRFDIETDKPSDLASFLGLQGAADELPRVGVTGYKPYGFSGEHIVKLADVDAGTSMATLMNPLPTDWEKQWAAHR